MFSEVITQIENRLLSACLEETDVKFPEVKTQRSATLLVLENRRTSNSQR